MGTLPSLQASAHCDLHASFAASPGHSDAVLDKLTSAFKFIGADQRLAFRKKSSPSQATADTNNCPDGSADTVVLSTHCPVCSNDSHCTIRYKYQEPRIFYATIKTLPRTAAQKCLKREIRILIQTLKLEARSWIKSEALHTTDEAQGQYPATTPCLLCKQHQRYTQYCSQRCEEPIGSEARRGRAWRA